METDLFSFKFFRVSAFLLITASLITFFNSWPVNKTRIDCSGGTGEKKLFCDFNSSIPSRSNIEIENISDSEINILFTLNDEKLFGTLDEILTDIINMTPLKEDETIVEKIFRYIATNHKHSLPLSDKEWYSTPMIYINSSGFGLCDDAAKALSMLANAAGYESRVWDLHGHVIADIKVDGQWQYFDPDYHVYFYNEKGDVASLQDLISNPDLIHQSG